jgi:PAS domain S-box-containing protein
MPDSPADQRASDGIPSHLDFRTYNRILRGALPKKAMTAFHLGFASKILPTQFIMIQKEARKMEKQTNDDALGNSELKYRRLFESAKDGIIILDAETGRITDVNPFLIKLLGYSFDQFLDKAIWEIGLFRDIFANQDNFLELKEKKYIRYDDLPLQTSDGKTINVEFVSNVYRQGNDSVIQCNIRDITERKIATDVMLAEKERLAVTLRSIGEGVITTDINGNVDMMNAVAEGLCGNTQYDARGEPIQTILKLIHAKSRQPMENPAITSVRTGLAARADDSAMVVSQGGIERPIHCGAAPIKDAKGRTFGSVLVFRDTTELQKMLEIEQRNQKLESLGVLAGGIAHDFNNLMTGIYGYIGMAMEASQSPQTAEYLSKALDTIERTRSLTRQLLTFAKGGAPIRKETAIGSLIKETIRFSLSGSNVSCEFEIRSDLRNCLVDKNQISQVIDNIVINAKQSMPSGGVILVAARNVEVSANKPRKLKQGHYIKISISDHGGGIAKEQIQKIFDPFYSTKTTGLGLGLSMCFSIIDQHEGVIEVESQPGKGSSFHIFLPSIEGQAAQERELGSTAKGSGKIIIMDDEEILREILESMLASLGYSVTVAKNGKEAVDCYFREKNSGGVAAMILDLTVPGEQGGMEAIKAIREDDPALPVFVSSGYAENDIMKNPTDYGFTASIRKPFTKSELSAAISEHLRRG